MRLRHQWLHVRVPRPIAPAPRRALATRPRRPPPPPPFPTVSTCPSPTCECAATPAGLDIDHKSPLNGVITGYAEQVLVCTGRDDWMSKIEEDNGGDNLAADLKELFGRGGTYSDVRAAFPSLLLRTLVLSADANGILRMCVALPQCLHPQRLVPKLRTATSRGTISLGIPLPELQIRPLPPAHILRQRTGARKRLHPADQAPPAARQPVAHPPRSSDAAGGLCFASPRCERRGGCDGADMWARREGFAVRYYGSCAEEGV